MTQILIHQANCIATPDDQNRELRGASILIENGLIKEVFEADTLPNIGATSFEQSRSKSLMRASIWSFPVWSTVTTTWFSPSPELICPFKTLSFSHGSRDCIPFGPICAQRWFKLRASVAMAELLMSGCTTSSDRLYIYPNGVNLEDSIEAAKATGISICGDPGQHERGSIQGRTSPDRVVEDEEAILKETQRLIEKWHDAKHGSMLNIAVAPCSPFTVSEGLMKASAKLARAYGVRLHTHLAENDHDIAYTLEKFNCTPTQYVEKLDWVEDNVWHAHCVKIDAPGIELFSQNANVYCTLPLLEHAFGQWHFATQKTSWMRTSTWV
jgi:hypothetical protein